MCLELKEYLSKHGWSIEEFAALRSFGMRPPKEMNIESIGEIVGQNEFPNATRLAKEAMKIPTVDSLSIGKMFRDDDDIRVAVWMSKILTTALQKRYVNQVYQKMMLAIF